MRNEPRKVASVEEASGVGMCWEDEDWIVLEDGEVNDEDLKRYR